MPVLAAELVGDDDDFLFLAARSIVVVGTVEDTWERLEHDHASSLLESLSPRFTRREVTATYADGYGCTTISRAGLRGTRRFDSVVWLEPPERSVELQIGAKTDLRCVTTYEAVPDGTSIGYAQSYRAKRASFESGAVLSQLQSRAVDVVDQRLAAIARLVG